MRLKVRTLVIVILVLLIGGFITSETVSWVLYKQTQRKNYTRSSSSSSSVMRASSSSVSSRTASSSSRSSSASVSSSTVVPVSADRPRGIYVLDSQKGTYRDGNIRNYDFVTGYVLRLSWAALEPEKGKYNFAAIDNAVSKLAPINKKLTLLLGGVASEEPAYIFSEPGVVTWTEVDNNPAHPGSKVRPVPWDSYTQARFRLFAEALASHPVPSTNMTLGTHPTLANVNFGIPGLGHIREKSGNEISSLPGYSRTTFTNAILQSLQTMTDTFRSKYVAVGFFPVSDTLKTPPLWDDIRKAILAKFNGITHPKIGFFMENLAASKDLTTGIITGTPEIGFGAPLYQSRDQAFNMFQALQSWNQPFSNPDKTLNTVPTDAIKYAFDTYKSTYVELYVPDIDDQRWWPAFREWHTKLHAK